MDYEEVAKREIEIPIPHEVEESLGDVDPEVLRSMAILHLDDTLFITASLSGPPVNIEDLRIISCCWKKLWQAGDEYRFWGPIQWTGLKELCKVYRIIRGL